MEVAHGDLPQSIESFTRQDIPFVLKVDGSLPVSFSGAGRCAPGPHTAPARELIDSRRSRRRVVEWTRHGRAGGAVTQLASAPVLATPCEDRPVPVPSTPLLLVGAWSEAALLPSEFWITNIGDRPLAQLFLLAKLADRVSLDFTETCEPVGIRDFEGRSFRGWHHHATLASVAHAAKLLGARPRSPDGYSRPRPVGRRGGPAPRVHAVMPGARSVTVCDARCPRVQGGTSWSTALSADLSAAREGPPGPRSRRKRPSGPVRPGRSARAA